MATTWSIARRQGSCSDTGRAFADGERHASILGVHEGALQRTDVCIDAWKVRQARITAGDEPEPLFLWFTRHEEERKKTVQLDLESLDRLFVELEGRQELQVRELRYVLCLLLMRKRRAKVEKVLREGEDESFVVKRPREEQRYKVYVYDFEPERLDQVRAQLQAIFDGAEGPHGIRLGLEDEDEDQVDGEARDEFAPEGGPAGAEDAPAGESQPPGDPVDPVTR